MNGRYGSARNSVSSSLGVPSFTHTNDTRLMNGSSPKNTSGGPNPATAGGTATSKSAAEFACSRVVGSPSWSVSPRSGRVGLDSGEGDGDPAGDAEPVGEPVGAPDAAGMDAEGGGP